MFFSFTSWVGSSLQPQILLHGQDKHGFILRTWIYLETYGKWRWINFGNILQFVEINIEVYSNWNKKFTTLVKVLCPLALDTQYIWYSFDFGKWGADSTRNTNHWQLQHKAILQLDIFSTPRYMWRCLNIPFLFSCVHDKDGRQLSSPEKSISATMI